MNCANYLFCVCILVCVCCTSCTAPNKFVQNQNVEFGEIETIIMKGDIDRPYPNVVDLADGSVIGIRASEETDAETSFEVRMNDLASLTLQMHTTPYGDSAQQEHGLRIRISNQQTTLDGGKPYTTPYSTSEPFKVALSSDGYYTRITVGCTALPVIVSKIPSSEWTILRANGAQIRIIDPLVMNELEKLEQSK